MNNPLPPMIYRVWFYKRIPDSNGHCYDCLQGVLEVHGENEQDAIDIACRRFAELNQTTIWSLRADSIKAEPLPGRKRVVSHICWDTIDSSHIHPTDSKENQSQR